MPIKRVTGKNLNRKKVNAAANIIGKSKKLSDSVIDQSQLEKKIEIMNLSENIIGLLTDNSFFVSKNFRNIFPIF